MPFYLKNKSCLQFSQTLDQSVSDKYYQNYFTCLIKTVIKNNFFKHGKIKIESFFGKFCFPDSYHKYLYFRVECGKIWLFKSLNDSGIFSPIFVNLSTYVGFEAFIWFQPLREAPWN